MSRTHSSKILEMFHLLYSAFGPQGWWPLSGRKRTVLAENKPLHMPKHHNGPACSDEDVLEIMVGAILTQNTSWVNVEKAIMHLREKKLLNISSLLRIHTDDLALFIKSSGYYNQKARKIKELVSFLQEYPIAVLQKKSINDCRRLLLGVHGIGFETADCIVQYGLQKDVFVVDAYTRRIGTRTGILKGNECYEDIRQVVEKSLPKKYFGEFHALLVALGKSVCRKNPVCNSCPLRFCPARIV